MLRYLAIKSANLPSAVAAPRTREFRCPPNVQIRNLLHMPGPGGPSGLLEEAAATTEGETIAAFEPNVGADELAAEGYSKNPCSEDIKVNTSANLLIYDAMGGNLLLEHRKSRFFSTARCNDYLHSIFSNPLLPKSFQQLPALNHSGVLSSVDAYFGIDGV